MRTIMVTIPRTSTYAETRKRVEAYLYSNFALGNELGWPEMFTISGEDRAGFTAEAQAARLLSGLIPAKVIA